MENTQLRKYTVRENIAFLYKRMWREDPKYISNMIFLAMAQMLLPLLSSATVAMIVAMVSQPQGWQLYRLPFGLVLVASLVCMCISQTMQGYTNQAGNVFRVSNMIAVTRKMLELPFGKLEQRDSIEAQMKAGEAIDGPEGAFQKGFQVLSSFLRNTTGLLLYSYLIGHVHPALVTVIVVFSLFLYKYSLGTNKIEKENKDRQAPLQKKTHYLVNHTGDFKAAKDMRLYHMEPWFVEEFEDLYATRFSLVEKVFRRKFNGTVLSSAFAVVRDGLAYFILVNQVLSGQLSPANFAFYFGIVASISQWVNGLMTDIVDFRYMSSEVQDFREYMDLSVAEERGRRMTEELALPVAIEFRDVCYRYEGAKEDTIHHLDWRIRPSEKVGMVGINGAGKSTIIKLLCGLYQPTSGEILINGIPQQEFTEESYYDLFAPVFQDYFELPITIEETIKEGESEHSLDYQQVLERSGMDQEIAKLPQKDQTLLVKRVNEGAVDLSGGQKQKLQLARAIYKNAPVLILDEPTAALDPIAENQIYLTYNEIAEDKTSIFISHRLSSTRFCDRIVYLEKGMILEAGTHEELMEKGGKYANMFAVQSQYYQEEWEGDRDAERK